VLCEYTADDFGAGAVKTNSDPTMQEMLPFSPQDEYPAYVEYRFDISGRKS
jgi:hypothetical protein